MPPPPIVIRWYRLHCFDQARQKHFVRRIHLFADRTPAPTMRANQLRLWLASFAYVLMCAARRIGLAGTKLAAATCGTIRLKLLKIGALITISVRRVKLAFASACTARSSCWRQGDYEATAAEPRSSPGINRRGSSPRLRTLPDRRRPTRSPADQRNRPRPAIRQTA